MGFGGISKLPYRKILRSVVTIEAWPKPVLLTPFLNLVGLHNSNICMKQVELAPNLTCDGWCGVSAVR
jgi:hypothetical protein